MRKITFLEGDKPLQVEDEKTILLNLVEGKAVQIDHSLYYYDQIKIEGELLKIFLKQQ